MYEVAAIVPRGQGTGFTLAGVRVVEAGNEAEAHALLSVEMADERNGVILVAEAFLDNLSARLRKSVDESAIPLVVGVPVITRWEYVSDRSEAIDKLIRRAVGYSIKVSGD
ncbi:MAG: hypothetical protein J7M24_07440 [Candidatus Latescibacteria bacterium]|nr:hypothetical protein [Candidatus Latescibacterota bacterium]